MKYFLLAALLVLICNCASSSATFMVSQQKEDQFQWLEEIQGEKPLAWVKEQNRKTSEVLEKDPHYSTIKSEIETILSSKDRIPAPVLVNGWIYNHWTDEKNPRGLWRRTTLAQFQSEKPQWEILLDIDALGKSENESWVFKGADFLKPQAERALINLSRGGKDAVVLREFDLKTKKFLAQGYALPEAKTNAEWLDENHLFVGTDFGPGSLTTSGYPRILKIWTRGQDLKTAPTIFEVGPEDMAAYAHTSDRPEGKHTLLFRRLNFYESQIFLFKNNSTPIPLPLPRKIDFAGVFKNRLYFVVNESGSWGGGQFKAGSLLSFSLVDFEKSKSDRLRLEYASDTRNSLVSTGFSKSKIWVEISRNVKPSVFQLLSSGKLKSLGLPEIGTGSIASLEENSDTVLLNYASFLTPPSLYLVKENAPLRSIKSLPEQFVSSDLTVDQFESTSKDGTKVPYFVVHKKDMTLDSSNPTLVYGYGGFQVSYSPFYLNSLGKVWLERGGVYVVANIRGGGEFGPDWHQAALKENRQRAYDDFFSVNEDLIKRKITSSEKLAINGGSNGGLLMGVSYTQRPELFRAVVCEVPLLDMMRYHKLLAGASWMAEYGNPDDPKEREFLLKYSPYQNVRPDVKHPDLFLMTSTLDDRVHPGHARKMGALLQTLGTPTLYYENTEGGHGAAADLKQKSKNMALKMTYLYQKLFEGR